MSDVVINVEGLSKSYQISHRSGSTYRTLREDLVVGGRRLLRRFSGPMQKETFWALREVSFAIREGDAVGIIGRNGAGKSTLLKILSNITRPTRGKARIAGRVGSLLEVGTGFHPELTGRENIFLNGTVLGMSRGEIARRFDDIVAFAEVEQFVDTPVKRYSSGMYVRLAFAIAAHLEPDILIVDEVLAVGDAEFQKKCLGKMSESAASGRTVLFVSHNLASVRQLCTRGLLLRKGQLVLDADIDAVVQEYSTVGDSAAERDLTSLQGHRGTGEYGRLTQIALRNQTGELQQVFEMGDTLVIDLTVQCIKPLRTPEIGIALTNSAGVTLQYFIANWEGAAQPLEPGSYRYSIQVPKLALYPGTFVLTPWFKRQFTPIDDQVDSALTFEVLQADVTGHQPYFDNYIARSGCETYAPSIWQRVMLSEEPDESS